MGNKTLKQLVKIHNAVAEAINEVISEQNLSSSEPEGLGGDDRIKCIRIMADGTIVYVKCKTK